jgi:hypothetical protein
VVLAEMIQVTIGYMAIKLAQAGRESNDQDTNLCSHQGHRDCLLDLTAEFAAISMGTMGKGDITAIFTAISNHFDISYSMITQTDFA